MKYMLAIYESEADFDRRSNEGAPDYWTAWMAYANAINGAGIVVGGSPLEPSVTATTLRRTGDARTVQDGPYADTKEQLGGFFLIDVPDLDTALEWAGRVDDQLGPQPVQVAAQAIGLHVDP